MIGAPGANSASSASGTNFQVALGHTEPCCNVALSSNAAVVQGSSGTAGIASTAGDVSMNPGLVQGTAAGSVSVASVASSSTPWKDTLG